MKFNLVLPTQLYFKSRLSAYLRPTTLVKMKQNRELTRLIFSVFTINSRRQNYTLKTSNYWQKIIILSAFKRQKLYK